MIKRILVIRFGALGDFIISLGPAEAIRRHDPDAHITLFTTKPFIELAQRSGLFNDIWTDSRPGWLDLPGLWRLRLRLRGGRFDLVYDLQCNDRSALYFLLIGPGRRPDWSGKAPGCSLPRSRRGGEGIHAFDLYAGQLAEAGIPDTRPTRLDWVDADVSRFGLDDHSYVLLIPGSAPHRPDKRWPTEHYAALAQRITANGLRPVVLGTGGEAALAAEITAGCPQTLDLCGKTSLFELGALARRAAAAIGNDTGPMHLISAVGCPCLVLFSAASDPVRSTPKGEKVQFLQRQTLAELPAATVWATVGLAPL
ncbi:ADP-heptose--LPS heptosyltransferase [uncultured Gammaproteobacteria bacterium]